MGKCCVPLVPTDSAIWQENVASVLPVLGAKLLVADAPPLAVVRTAVLDSLIHRGRARDAAGALLAGLTLARGFAAFPFALKAAGKLVLARVLLVPLGHMSMHVALCLLHNRIGHAMTRTVPH